MRWDEAFWHYWLTHDVPEAERLADMLTPRDSPPPFATPVDPDTGMPLTERQTKHLGSIKEAADALAAAMHAAEGSQPPDGPFQDHHWQSRRMAIAGTHLETLLLFARKAALESK